MPLRLAMNWIKRCLKRSTIYHPPDKFIYQLSNTGKDDDAVSLVCIYMRAIHMQWQFFSNEFPCKTGPSLPQPIVYDIACTMILEQILGKRLQHHTFDYRYGEFGKSLKRQRRCQVCLENWCVCYTHLADLSIVMACFGYFTRKKQNVNDNSVTENIVNRIRLGSFHWIIFFFFATTGWVHFFPFCFACCLFDLFLTLQCRESYLSSCQQCNLISVDGIVTARISLFFLLLLYSTFFSLFVSMKLRNCHNRT